MEITAVKIQKLGWPEASLNRYEMFSENWHLVKGSLVVYLDADTVALRGFEMAELEPGKFINGVALVRHPGYYKAGWIKWIRDRTINCTWERRSNSEAFVPLWRRRKYVCGGVWMGEKNSLSGMVTALAEQVATDRSKGVTAVWHDESHLNAWLSKNRATLLTPIWAYAPAFAIDKGQIPIIEVLEKPKGFVRVPTSTESW